MDAIQRILFPMPDYHRTTLSMLRWWEARRPVYNLVVGVTGLVTLSGVLFFSALPPGHVRLAGLAPGVLIYAILANVCYTAGWLTETLMRAVWGRRAPDAGPLLFRQGLLFAVGVTLLPVALAAGSWLVRAVLWLT